MTLISAKVPPAEHRSILVVSMSPYEKDLDELVGQLNRQAHARNAPRLTDEPARAVSTGRRVEPGNTFECAGHIARARNPFGSKN